MRDSLPSRRVKSLFTVVHLRPCFVPFSVLVEAHLDILIFHIVRAISRLLTTAHLDISLLLGFLGIVVLSDAKAACESPRTGLPLIKH